MSQQKHFQFWLSEAEAAALRRVGHHEPGEYDTANALYRDDMAHLRNVVDRLLETYDLGEGARSAFVTTTDTCSNCGSKLANGETSRLEYQQRAFELSKELQRLKNWPESPRGILPPHPGPATDK